MGGSAGEDEAGDGGFAFKAGFAGAGINAVQALACDGIAGTSVQNEPWAGWKMACRGWIGIAATLAEPVSVEPGAICMHIGAGGYVGLVRMPGGRAHLAAALDPRKCRSAGGPRRLIQTIFESAGVSIGSAVASARLHGTGTLTRHRPSLGGYRILAVGDACGYVEPFTGEGMAWAVRSAAAAVELLPSPGRAWPTDLPARWGSAHAAIVGPRQRWCRAARLAVHHPALASALMGLGSLLPWISQALAAQVCGVEESLA